MYPSPGYQPERATRRHIVAQVYLDIVIAGKALVLSAAEGIEILAVEVLTVAVTSVPWSSVAFAMACGGATVVMASLAPAPRTAHR